MIAIHRAKGSAELLRTDSAQGQCQYCEMTKKKRDSSREFRRTTIASIKREMQRSRLTESVRNHEKGKVAPVVEQDSVVQNHIK
jgi:hypothetical protein